MPSYSRKSLSWMCWLEVSIKLNNVAEPVNLTNNPSQAHEQVVPGIIHQLIHSKSYADVARIKKQSWTQCSILASPPLHSKHLIDQMCKLDLKPNKGRCRMSHVKYDIAGGHMAMPSKTSGAIKHTIQIPGSST